MKKFKKFIKKKEKRNILKIQEKKYIYTHKFVITNIIAEVFEKLIHKITFTKKTSIYKFVRLCVSYSSI